MGRPSDYTEEIATRICREIADGKSLKTICEATDLPSRETVRHWLQDNEIFLGKYVRAREEQADHYADEINDIADATLRGKHKAENARVAIDAKKWVASKLKPKKYGDKMDVTSGGERVIPILGGITKRVPEDDSSNEAQQTS